MKTILIPLARLAPDPDNPRSAVVPDAAVDTLAESISVRGLLLPLRVRPADAAGTHTVVSGHRRLAALRRLGASEAPCVVADGPLTDDAVLAEQLAENIHRSDLDPVSEAEAFRRYLSLRNVTAAQAAAELNVSPARISRALPLLELPPAIREAVQGGAVAKETAYHLARLPDGPDRDALLTHALAGTLTRDKAARAARKPVGDDPASAAVKRVACRLTGGRTLTLAGAGLHLDALIDALEEVLKEARKARTQGLDVVTLVKVLRHRAGKGGAA